MPLRNATPLPFLASTVSDTIDGTDSPPGCMGSLSNLVPHPKTAGLFVPRPAAEELTDFTGFSSPGFISCWHVRGEIIYGLIASALTPGYDQPFAYDATTDTFTAITGVTALNVPTSQASSGAWSPPTIVPVGIYLVVTSDGFPGGGGAFFGWFDISNPATPTWDAGNTAGNPLPSVPVTVGTFNDRAWYAMPDGTIVWSDALDPLTVTNANQVLGTNENTPVTAFGSQPLNTQFGGIISSLIAFKGATTMYQITGDSTTMDLSINQFDTATGTLARNSITQSPKGLGFVSPEGLRFVDYVMHVSDPVGVAGTGITAPFIYTAVASRICAAYNNDVIRITTQNTDLSDNPFQEYWYHIARGIWSGPHTSVASLIHSFAHTEGTEHASFVLTPVGIDATIWDSHVVATNSSTYVEDGTQLTWTWQTSFLPDTQQMAENAMVETTIALALPALTVTVVALSDQGDVIDQVDITGGAGTFWNEFLWGAADWGSSLSRYTPRQVEWTEPIVFKKLQMQVTGNSIDRFVIGNLYMRYQILGYLLQATGT